MVFLIGKLNAWDASATDGLNCRGYSGVGSDGEYNYYTPYYNGSAYHGIVLRQKIFSIFKDAGTWEAYDAGSVDGLTSKGYLGNPIFDGQFMYFAPNNNGSVSGIVLRYDTTKPFKSSASWEAYDAGSVDGLTSKGTWVAVFDGRYYLFRALSQRQRLQWRFLALRHHQSPSKIKFLGGLRPGQPGRRGSKRLLGGSGLGNFIYFSPWYNICAPWPDFAL